MRIAEEAKSRGGDPENHPEIPPAKDLAERIENLVGIEGVAQRVRELETQSSREEAALHIGSDFAEGMFGKRPEIDLVEGAIRTAVAILTEGVVAAPIEGIARVGLGKNDDGTSYLKIYYAGPIRSAGGTAQTLSVLVADYVRRKLGIDRYKPRKDEVERYVEEISLYERAANLQYNPSAEEIRLIVENCPVCIDGEPTEEEEVSGYRNLDRVETNRLRGGMALVIAEGIAQKAPKMKEHVYSLGIDGWEWLDDLTAGVKREDEAETLKPKEQFLEDIIAGRPVFSHPSTRGGFRLRYGRARNSGFATAGINPATMILMDDFIAPGTQLKIERPGKAAGTVPVDTIEGPTVRLINGDVPLHPKYTYLWHDITVQELEFLAHYVSEKGEHGEVLMLPSDPDIKKLLEILLVPHRVRENRIIVEHDYAHPLIRCLGLGQDLSRSHVQLSPDMKTVDAVSTLGGITIRERAPIRIGSRMGRPEKSKKREMHPPVHVCAQSYEIAE